MPKLFALTQMLNGLPDTAPLQQGRDYGGHVHVDSLGGFGAYLFSGTGAQLTALNALPSVVGLVVVTETGAHWPELDNPVAAGIRTAINTWLTNHGQANIGAGLTYRAFINILYRKFNATFDADSGADVT